MAMRTHSRYNTAAHYVSLVGEHHQMRRKALMIDRICEGCGAAFSCPDWQVARGWGRFCSRPCLFQANCGKKLQDPAERFWEKVERSNDPDACWHWLGKIGRGGYGRFFLNGHEVAAHRFAWELTNGPMSPE